MKISRIAARVALLIALSAVSLGHTRAQQSKNAEPSLEKTFEWMANTLQPSEGNNIAVHHPFRPYPAKLSTPEETLLMRIDPSVIDEIKKFSRDGCRVEFEADHIDNDVTLFGFRFVWHETDTFDLKDIDPTSVRIEDACGPVRPFNCEDQEGKLVGFKTSDARPTIHQEGHSSSERSRYGLTDPKESQRLDDLCKRSAANCPDTPEHKYQPEDMTSLILVFSTPEYAQRFVKAFRHAVELCGGKPSAF